MTPNKILGLATILFASISFVLSMKQGRVRYYLALVTLLIAVTAAILMFILISGVTITI